MCIHNIHMRACVCPYKHAMHANNTYHTHLNSKTSNFSLAQAHTDTHQLGAAQTVVAPNARSAAPALWEDQDTRQCRYISPNISVLMNSPLKTTSKLNFESFQAKMRPLHLVWDLDNTLLLSLTPLEKGVTATKMVSPARYFDQIDDDFPAAGITDVPASITDVPASITDVPASITDVPASRASLRASLDKFYRCTSYICLGMLMPLSTSHIYVLEHE